MARGRAPTLPKSPIGRIFANTAWPMGGKGFGAVCGIAYLAILTRSLGLKGFGHFALIFGTAQAVVALGVAMVFLVRYAAPGIAWAVAVGGVVSFLALGGFARHTLNRMEHRVA